MKNTSTLIRLVLLAALFSTSSMAEISEGAIYLGFIEKSNNKIEVKFILAKSPTETSKFSPIQAYTINPDVRKKRCGFKKTDDFRLPQEYLSAPIYAFNNKSRQLSIEKLPIFFSTLVSAKLAQKNLVKSENESLPYHSCTRILWLQLLGLGMEN